MTAPVASHRKPRHHPLGLRLSPGNGLGRGLAGNTVRTAATLAIAGAATATVLDGTGHAAPRPVPARQAQQVPGQASGQFPEQTQTPEQIGRQVGRLYKEAEIATEEYDGAKERADRAAKELGRLQDEAARASRRLNAARAELGTMAASQYRAGGVDPTVRLALSADPDHFLEGATVLDRAGSSQAAAVTSYARRLDGVRQTHDRAQETAGTLRGAQSALKKHRITIVRKLAAAEKLLNRLTDEQRHTLMGTLGDASADGSGPAERAGSVHRADRSGGRTGSGTGSGAGTGSAPGSPTSALMSAQAAAAAAEAPDARAARAVAYAYRALGKPYVWGATGPSSYDCSGLTQAAWRAGGVSLPRTTYTQINAGTRVNRSELMPGDLVFFYSGVSHVGLYIGGGKMIHAPHPGAPVRVAPIDLMPFAGATRPA
ncbi:C40 family peptidase [Streptomyces sp. MST-110588]|uniref:C40 family peptidase n=1 Tax=Streptomyces sp. MST-110588 TaxID=2833628 RepID=UPI001F5D0918|nr:C40 family peptidase [Streptomyces sp. MST-110588]UNO40335.1 C40 family peptidase [Streptomyces sp. MST-110588]